MEKINCTSKSSELQDQCDIVLSKMGSFMFGGTVSHKDNQETFHGDHGYAQYFVPKYAHNYPIILWHGMGQSGKCWESTTDGRDGFWQIFVKRQWPVYIIDQPRRGRAGYTLLPRSDKSPKIPILERESAVWDNMRIGKWNPPESATFFKGTQFPVSPLSVDQYFRQQAPDTGDEPITDEHRTFMANTMTELLKQSGPSILFTHSHSGQYGWQTGMVAPELVKAIISYEPGSYLFPIDDYPGEIKSPLQEMVNNLLRPSVVPMEDFLKLTKIPITIYYGDFISENPQDDWSTELWRVSVKRAEQFVEMINKYGGKAKLTMLPKVGIYGNTHFAFSDMNNLQFAELIEKDIHEFGLDGFDNSYKGPKKKELNNYTIALDESH